MRVLISTGLVMEITKAVAVCEQRVAFNGREIRQCERAADIAYANGIAFVSEAKVQDFCGMTPGGTVLIGNLSNEFVREVLASLVQHECADLSSLKLQKAQAPASRYTFDNGVSDAYMIQGYEASMCCVNDMGYPFLNGESPAASETEDDEDDEEEDCGDE